MINKVILHGADAQPTSPNHSEETVTTITALSGYTHIDMSTQEVDEATMVEGESKVYIDGESSGVPHTRYIYNLKLFPMTFNSTSTAVFWSASNERTLRAVLAKKYLWIQLTQYASDTHSSITYHASGKAIPVVLKGYSHSSGDAHKRIGITLWKRWRES